ncbi:MAG: penicillin-binding protein 2, partial [Gaiellales bacterium]|nr:penicillin-binding protein 2 [Gaiellales bacterium]
QMSQPPPEPVFPPRPHGRLQLRLGVLGVAVVVLFMLLVLRLWALQVLNTRTFVAQAASNHEKQVVVRAPRGEILDRKGRVLVRNRVAYELQLDPGAVRDSDKRHRLTPASRRGPTGACSSGSARSAWPWSCSSCCSCCASGRCRC